LSDSTDAATQLLLRFVLNTAAFATGELVAAFELPRARRRSDPVSSRDGFTLSISTREGAS